MTSADFFFVWTNRKTSPGKVNNLLPIACCIYITVYNHSGLRKDWLTYPDGYASYAVPVRQYRYLQSRLLQCMDHSIPPCGLLMLRVVTPRIRDFHSPASHF